MRDVPRITTRGVPKRASEMTLREHYVGLALQSLIMIGVGASDKEHAERAVKIADELLEALNGKP